MEVNGVRMVYFFIIRKWLKFGSCVKDLEWEGLFIIFDFDFNLSNVFERFF